MIKLILKLTIELLLKIEARLILWRYKPKIAAVTGTVGKTSTKDVIALVLKNKFNVRKSEKSYNSEIGIPLTIIGAESGWNNPFKWLLILIKGAKVFIKKESNYPEWLVLEMGVDRPKDMEKLTKWIKPNIAILTALAETPVHVEYFRTPDELNREKIKLINALKEENYAVLNGDDELIFELKERAKTNTIFYGFSEGNDLRASNYNLNSKGISFKIDYRGSIVPVRLPNIFGKQYVYATLAGIAVGLSQDLNLVEITETLAKFKPPPGRLNLIKGIENSFIIDDTYNSSPVAVLSALETMKELSMTETGKNIKRKIAVLGDMLELGKFTVFEHKKIGKLVKDYGIDLLFAIGPRSRFIVEEAKEKGFAAKKIFEFSSSDKAKIVLKEKIKEGDLILIKGSQSIRMEKIVEEIMAHPEKKGEILVRQEKEWLKK